MPEAARPEVPIVDITALSSLDGLNVDSIALFALSGPGPLGGVGDLVDWHLMGQVGTAMVRQQFAGGRNETLLVPAGHRLGSARVFVFGMGPSEACTAEAVAERLSRAVTAVAQAGGRRLAMVIPSQDEAHRAVGGPSHLEDLFVAAGNSTNGHIIVKVLRHRVD